MLLMTPRDLHCLWQQILPQDFVLTLIGRMQATFGEWQNYQHCPRLA